MLGAADSGQRDVLADLIDGLGADESAAVLLSSKEGPEPADARLPNVSRWTLGEGPEVEAELPRDTTHVFILFDGRTNPVDQIEAFSTWLENRSVEVARVLLVVHCQLLEKNPKLFAWYEACIHFSDVVLLNRRDGVPNKWISDFRAKFEARHYPCLFEFVKDGAVKNPALVLAPVALRISHVFDEEEWIAEDEDDDEDEQQEGEEVEMKPALDPYLERRTGGRRIHELPHIEDFLPKPPDAPPTGS
jgi:hypothetical protein